MRVRLALTALIWLALAEICLSAPNSSERILDFHSDMALQSDGTLLVRETIVVNSTGNQIRHGIYRDFPTRYKDRLGNNFVVGFQLISAELDGFAETSRVEDQFNGKRIYLGDPKYFVAAGHHTYVISYTTNRQLGFFADHDQLYWNVTGNGWAFPIEHASAAVTLPPSISPGEVALDGFTGPQGSFERSLTHSAEGETGLHFESTRPLAPREGLSIVLSWPKGLIAPPTSQQQLNYFLSDNHDALLGLGAFLILLIYYIFVWAAVGRDPRPGAIMPLYEPPANLSPAAIRYLVRMGGFDNKTFAAAILDLAARGFLKIKFQADSYTLYRTGADNRALTPDEQNLANLMFGGRDQLWLHNENHTVISSGMKSLKQWLRTGQQKIYFFTNTSYLIPAIVFSIAAVTYATFLHAPARVLMIAFLAFWLSIWTLAVIGLVLGTIAAWKEVLHSHPGGASVGKALLFTLFSLPFLAAEGFAIFAMTQAASVAIAIFLFASIGIHVLFRYLLKAPTVAGRKLLDQIEGFKMFLGAVDGDRLNRMNPPEQTPETFERFLPYAFALNVERAWAQKFSGVLSAASTDPNSGAAGYTPSFYSGNNWNSFAAGSGGGFTDSFASAMSSASSASGSSDGGGGSGGGGGGGGGGGW